jgi:hypothetical protein
VIDNFYAYLFYFGTYHCNMLAMREESSFYHRVDIILALSIALRSATND